MNIIESYYIKKANLHHTDDFHERIEDNDINLLRKAKFYMLIAPVMTFGIVYFG